MRRYVLFLIVAVFLFAVPLGCAIFTNDYPEGTTRAYIRAVVHRSASELSACTCEAAQGQRPEDTTLYKLLDKWISRWQGGEPDFRSRAEFSTHRRINQPTLVYVTLSGMLAPHYGPSYEIQPPGVTLPLVFEGGEWRVCDLGTDELKVTHGPTYDPPPD